MLGDSQERGSVACTGWLIEGPKGAAKILALHPNTLRSRVDKATIKLSRHGIS